MAQPKAASAAAQLSLAASACIAGAEAAAMVGREGAPAMVAAAAMVVFGHRGKGMNALGSADPRLREVKENSLRSFHAAARVAGVSYVEFDVQVTKDGYPVIFHDDFIFTEQDGEICGRRVTDLRLDEFLSYGPQKDQSKAGKPLFRKLNDGRVVRWDVQSDDALCTLQEALDGVDRRVGFNVELKFDDDVVYREMELTGILQAILKVVFEHAKERPIFFSSFQPDAARIMRKLQDRYPVYFLTKGGTQVFADERRNSLEAAVKLCVAGGLRGIVSEARAVLRQPSAIGRIKEAGLSLLTYGQLNNVPKAVYLQQLMGVDGVIVDLVAEIAAAVSEFAAAAAAAVPVPERDSSSSYMDGGGDVGLLETTSPAARTTASFSRREDVSFLLRLTPELVQ
uniref:glycerophosphodiester phosphodiesterase n=1 Tax=Oryza sativa TaxID=4530 RepID=Q01LB2_ORYSA|nr:H0718E12.3 [Oryza sativa]